MSDQTTRIERGYVKFDVSTDGAFVDLVEQTLEQSDFIDIERPGQIPESRPDQLVVFEVDEAGRDR